ncbi:uncharacterized protein KY384_006990 [Bacidia gigantensis]|uniref:uncharacterized protein n=1 Tax=Bacidia gigantensis TaxID=2732470 RepID=UPI001D04BCF8|nr:uncharacterized protein KY384_006990 [Bacidia gigantensis]KAG8528074.1 hypothetical protein KY384_006990 [Bacidia gigantensis]
MARHHQHHRHHGHPLFSENTPPALNVQPVHLRQIIDNPLAQAKSLFIRTPPGVSGSPSDSSDSSTSDGSSSSSSSDTSSSDTSGSSSSDTSSSSTSSSKGHQGVNISIPVALGVMHVRKLRQEDANDPHKSLDFGWDPAANTGTKKRGKSQKRGKSGADVDGLALEKGARKDRGLSMDMDVGSPYLMPPGLHGSRESLHSMSRTIHSQDDRYRPATTYVPGDNASLHSQKTRRAADDSSSQAGSSSLHRAGRDDMKQDLLGNAQRMSRSVPPMNRVPVPEIKTPDAAQEMPRKPLATNPTIPPTGGLAPTAGFADSRDSYQPNEHLRKSNNYLGAFIHSRDPSADVKSPETEKSEYLTPRETPATPTSTFLDTRKSPPPATNTSSNSTRPSRHQSLQSSHHASIEQNSHESSSDYGDTFKITPASPHLSHQDQHPNNRGSSQEYMPPIDEYSLGVDENDFGYDVRRLSVGVRPLPPEDPTDNPEQRANRIRSFYKEYFDDSKPAPTGAEYYEDYDENYLGDGAIFDPSSGQYVTAHSMPYAEPYGRRAMTPPPRVGGRRHAATIHLLRKSGTFTALDFAPPPRFKNSDTASDAGSIRSNRSAMSARTQHAVRTGAYRVSRIPKEVVGTRGDLMDSLKPQWNMHNNTGTIGMTVK